MRKIFLVCVLLLTSGTGVAEEFMLLRFRADWCAPCRQQKVVFADAKIPATLQQYGVTDMYVDADQQPAAMRKWRVTQLPTTILVRLLTNGRAAELRRHDYGVMSAQKYRQFVLPPQAP